jgi:hypothetical protein
MRRRIHASYEEEDTYRRIGGLQDWVGEMEDKGGVWF